MTISRTRFFLRHLAVVGAVGALASGAACSSDDIAERVAEGIAERATDGDVDFDIDSDSGRVEVSTPDGDFTIGGDELPEGFPAEVPLPDGLTVVTSMRLAESGTTVFTVAGQVARSASAVDDEVSAAFERDGWEETMRSTSSFGGSDSTTLGHTKDGWTVVVSINDDEEGGAGVNYSVSEES